MKAKKIGAATLTDEQFHAIARALSDPRRMAIFQQIAATDGMSCSCLQEHDVISPATISHHMKELNEAGLVEMERKGREAHLTLCRPIFQAYINRLASIAKL
jgi:ArsR family transcriptional regulator, arsenate/arsenite/antimonite-responsive transcriptional repressor